jgi:hypothetical protein
MTSFKIFRRKYAVGSGADVYFPLTKRAVVDLAVGADWTPAAGDVKVSLDGAAAANIATLPVAVAMGNGAYWKFVFSNAELTCKSLVVTVADSATKAVEDAMFVVETYGSASGQQAFDPTDIIRMGLTALPNAVYGATGGIASLVIRSSTAQAGAAGTITLDASASAVDNFYQRCKILTTGGTGAGQCRSVASYVGATKVATITPNWATNPDNTTTFAVLPDGLVDLSSAGVDLIVVESGINLRQAAALIGAATAGKVSGAATSTITVKNMDGTTTRIVATVDADGNRSALTLTAPA